MDRQDAKDCQRRQGIGGALVTVRFDVRFERRLRCPRREHLPGDLGPRAYPGLGPIAVGYAKDATGSFQAGLYVLAAAACVSTLTALGCALWMKRGVAPAGRMKPRTTG